MNEVKRAVSEYIDRNAKVFTDVSDAVWADPELSLKEFHAAKLYCDVLREQGFTVEENLCGIKTAFSGTFGSGRPIIGILGEFDALSGLSQKAGEIRREEVTEGGCGHGCGHNMLGAGALAAACAVKDHLEKTHKQGTVIFFGCPGEEGGAAKAFMAREHVWEKLDAAVTWHPDDHNRVVSGSCISCIQKEYIFTGIASHAAGAPENGRSALDAAELMNIGVQFLREHMPGTARVHYAVTDGGGLSPNVVQPKASVLYMVRDHTVEGTIELDKRVDRIAEGAALMTDTKLQIRFIDGCANTISNEALERLTYENLCEVELPVYTDEEKALADGLVRSYEITPKTLAERLKDDLGDEELAFVDRMSDCGRVSLNNFVVPYAFSKKVNMGSTDVGDVSWQTPAVQLYTCAFAAGSPGHSWQNVSCGGSSIGHKALLLAGKVLAGTAIDIFEDPSKLVPMREEFERRTKDGYHCPIPKDAVPTAI